MKKLAKTGLLMATIFTLTACGMAQQQETIQPEESTENTDQIEVTVQDSDTESDEESTQNSATINPADYVGYYNNDANDIMEISQSEDGSYIIDISLYRLYSFDRAELTAESDKLVFNSTDGNGGAVKGVVYPDGDQLTLEFIDADWTYIKTGDKFTGFTLADTSEPLLNGAGEYYTTLAIGEGSEYYGDMVVKEYSFEGQTMTIIASFGYYPALDSEGNLSDTMLDIETTTVVLPLDNAYLYTSGGDVDDQPFDSLDDFKTYLDQVKNSGLGLIIRIENNEVISVGITS